jgi:hypothetical protein
MNIQPGPVKVKSFFLDIHAVFPDFKSVQNLDFEGIKNGARTQSNELLRRKRRRMKPVEAAPKAPLKRLSFFAFNLNWTFDAAPIQFEVRPA